MSRLPWNPTWLDHWVYDSSHVGASLSLLVAQSLCFSMTDPPLTPSSPPCQFHSWSFIKVGQLHQSSFEEYWTLSPLASGIGCNRLRAVQCLYALHPASASSSCARNTCIGRSGTWARSLHNLPIGQFQQSSEDKAHIGLVIGLLLHIASHLVPLAKGLLGFFLLGLCRMLARSVPGHNTLLGRSASVLANSAPTRALRAFAIYSPAGCSVAYNTICNKADSRRQPGKTRLRCSKMPARGSLSSFMLRMLALPVLVRSGNEDVTALHHIHEAVTASQPEELPSGSVGPVAPPEEPPTPNSVTVGDIPKEPIQTMVARCQTESHLEAYGEVLDPPVLRICVLIPGRKNITLRLSSAEGGAPSALAQARYQVEPLLEERCDLVPITHQALTGVLTLVAVPKWIKESLRSVVVFDLSAIGGPLFADIVWQLVYRSDVEALAAPYHDDRVNVYTQNCPVGWAAGTPYKLLSGQVVQVQRPDVRPQWKSLPEDSLWPLWTRYEPPIPECTSWEKWLIAREDGASLLKGTCCDSATLYQAVADQIGCDVSQLCFQRDPHGVAQGNFTYQGRQVQGIIAVGPRDAGPVEVGFTFVDARKVGRGIRAFLRNVWVEASAILRCIDPKVPPGYSVSLCTCACAVLEAGDTPWDWQEVSFRADDLHQPYRISLQDVAVPAETTSLSTNSGCNTATEGSTGIYTAISSGPLDPAHQPLEHTATAPSAEGIWFLLFAPDRRPETIWLKAQAPHTWDEVYATIPDARDPDHSALYGYICKVHPQPSAEFASLICLPLWARQRTAVLLDSRSYDGRMYCLVIDSWIQWGSFLLHAGLPDNDTFVVVVNGIARVRGRPLILKQGDLVQVLEYGASIPPALDLGDLFFAGDSWVTDPPLAFSSSFSHYLVLHEGGARGIDADFHAITSAYSFQEFAADALQFAQHRTTLKTTSPQIHDGMYKGVLCRAVVLVTECLPTIPVPPARLTVPLTVVFLDMRPVLGGFNWRILARGETALDVFTRGLNLEPPPGYSINIDGGSRTVRKGVVFLQAEDRAVLVISYVDQTDAEPVVDPTTRSADSDSSTDSASGHDEGDPGDVTREAHSTVRSRSPRHTRTRRRNRGRRSGAGPAAPALTTAIHKLGIYTEPLKQVDSIANWTELYSIMCGSSHLCLAPKGNVSKTVHPLAAKGTTCKILVEPSGGSASEEIVIAHLRYAAPRLGLPWRYMTPVNAFHIDDDNDSDSEADALPSPPVRVCFRILLPGFDTERVEVSLVFPTTLAEVLPFVQDARSRTRVQNFPRLIPASPQPLVGDGVLLACPSWSVEIATSRRQVCIDCSTLDGRIYSALVPPYLYGADIPGLVGLPSNLEYSIFAGPYGDLLRWDSQCHLVDGDTIFVCPEDSAPPSVVPLHVALLGRQHWTRQPRVPEPRSHGICCVVFGTDNILHINTRGDRANFRTQIAASIGISQCSMRIISSSPRVLDAAIDGFPCRSVIIVSEAVPLDYSAIPWVLLDARTLFLGWRGIPAPRGQLSCRDAIDGLLRELGSGWRLWFRDVPFSTDLLNIRDGQVLVVEVIHERIARPPESFENVDAPTETLSAAASGYAAGGGSASEHLSATVSAHEGSRNGRDDPTTDRLSEDERPHQLPDQGAPDTTDPEPTQQFAVVPFLILRQNYEPEWISVRLAVGIEVPEALNAAAAARPPAAAVRMPILCAVHPQPSSACALVVGLPAWRHPGSIIAIDSRASNGRLFALQVVGPCYRHDFLKLAGLDDNDDHDVYFRDIPWPLPADRPVHPSNGDLVLICPHTARHHVVHSLADMLQFTTNWEPSPTPVENTSDIAWVLGPAGPSPLQVPRQRQHRARYDIAAHTGIHPRELALTPAFGGVLDFADRGILMRNVVAARSLTAPDGVNQVRAPVCLLDLRPVLLGFDWISCPNGIFMPERIQTRIAQRCPPGFQLGRIANDACFGDLQDPFLIQDGDVVTLVFKQLDSPPDDDDTRASGEHPDPPTRDGDESHSSHTQVAHPSHASSQQDASAPPSSGGADPRTGSTASGHRSGRAIQLSYTWKGRLSNIVLKVSHDLPGPAQTLLGTGLNSPTRPSCCHNTAAVPPSSSLTFCSSEPARHRLLRRLAPYNLAIYDLLLCCILFMWQPTGSVLGLLACVSAISALAPGRLRGSALAGGCGTFALSRTAILLVYLANPDNGVLGMQHYGHGANLKALHRQTLRAIPAPARAGIIPNCPPQVCFTVDTCSPVGLVTDDSPALPPFRNVACQGSSTDRGFPFGDELQCADDLACLDEPLITLLEASVTSPDSQAFFLAATLLETVLEHLEEAAHCQPPPAQAQQLCLHDHVPPPSFNLDVDRVPLPHGQPLLRHLVQPWPTEWLLPHDWARDDLPTTAKAQLQHAKPWKHLLSSAPRTELWFSIYTDGSATQDGRNSGFAVVIFVCTQDSISPLGIVGGGILGCNASPWVVDCPPALHAEHVALAVAILWCLQMTGVLQCVTCQLCFDCTAAGWSAEGSWQTLSHTGALVHHLDMVARATPGVHLTYSHVKGHSNHPWNDLADFVAKTASHGQVWPGPPRDLCVALHSQDISWLAVEQDARRHHAIPIHDGDLIYAPPEAAPEPLLPEHLIPVLGDVHHTDTTGHRCWAYVVTINVQSLRGKCKYIEEQLHSRAVNVACLQETKLDGGTITSQYYMRLHSRADSHWGVAVWVHRQLGVLCLDDENLHVVEHDVAVLHECPRLLVLLITKGQLRIGLISGHCPHSTRPEERDAFLATIAPILQRLKHVHLVIGGVDLNGRIPPEY